MISGEKPLPERKMLELFRHEIETQTKILSEGLLAYNMSKNDVKLLESLMRAAHSIKGAAKVFDFQSIIQLAHVLEDVFLAARSGKIILSDDFSETLFKALDAIESFIMLPPEEMVAQLSQNQKSLNELTEEMKRYVSMESIKTEVKDVKLDVQNETKISKDDMKNLPIHQDLTLRMTAQNLNRLMGLAAESMVEARWLRPFCDSLQHLKVATNEMLIQLEMLKSSLGSHFSNEVTNFHFHSLHHSLHEYQNLISDRLSEFEMFITRHSNLTDRLYSEVIEARMRPFSDGIEGFPRMIWETARRLKKKARLEVQGKSILIDREILEKLEVPLGHLLRNAVDHGIESPEERIAAGKPSEGLVHLEASHKGGMLEITVSDDGRGVDLDLLRNKIVEENLMMQEMALKINDQELLQFMFLPGFSTSDQLTDISGRGMGLNIVQNMLQEVSGSIFIENHPGKGIKFRLQLPLTLSVIRALITKVDPCIFAFPLARIEHALLVPREEIEQIEGRDYFSYLGVNIGLILASQILNYKEAQIALSLVPVVIVRHLNNYYGIVVDKFLGEKELVIQDIESRLGKTPCISSGSVMETGDPVFIIDIDDTLETIEKLLSSELPYKIHYGEEAVVETTKKRVLVVDDSISVREVECRLLRNRGYDVESAVNGADAWNAIRLENYDLVVTDVDMPRMNGIELVQKIKADARLKDLPVMIVSYKEREGDRLLGLNAGADYYLAKSTFGDEALIDAVMDLIGEP